MIIPTTKPYGFTSSIKNASDLFDKILVLVITIVYHVVCQTKI